MQIANWLGTLLSQFFSNMGLAISADEFETGHIALVLDNNIQLHLDIDSTSELVIITMRLPHRNDEGGIMTRLLKHNNYQNLTPLLPTIHMFEEDIVLRTCINDKEVSLETLERILHHQFQTNNQLIGYE